MIWDVGLVITYLKNLGASCSLSLKALTYKLVALITLLSASRVNYIASLSIESMELTATACKFYPTKLLKHSRPSFQGEPLTLMAYPLDEDLCVIKTLREYLQRRKHITHAQLFISYRKPHGPVKKDTVSRWLKDVLILSGIDASIFSSHSYRAASTSKASVADVPITDILKQGQWTTQKTWQNHYRLQITQPNSTVTFSDAILKQ